MRAIMGGRRSSPLAALCLADFVTVGALIVPITVAVARHLTDIRPAGASWTAEQGVSMVFVVAALTSLVSQITFGWLSDRVRTSRSGRLGYLVGGTLLGGACLWQVGQTATLGSTVGWFALSVWCYGATLASIAGSFADLVDGGTRARSAGWLAGAASGATAVPLGIYALLPVSDFSSFGLFPLAAFVVTLAAAGALLPQVRALRDGPRAEAGPDAEVAEMADWRGQFWLLVLQRGLSQLAFVFGAIYPFLFLVRRVGLDRHADATSQWASAVAGAADVVGMVAAVGAGYVAARLMNSLTPMRVGLVVMATGLLGMAFATTTWEYLLAQLVIGFGGGAYFGCDLGLVFRMVPPRSAGRYLGFFNIARNLPQTIVPIVGPALLAIGGGDRIGADRSQNYTAFFVAGALIAGVALAAMSGLRVTSADSVPVRAPA